MAAIARGGAGNTHFAEQADEAGAALTAEVDDLLEQVIQAASLTIRPGSDATAIHLVNDLPATAVGGAVMVELGDFYAGEERRLMLVARRAGDERAGPDPDLRAGAPVRGRRDSHHRDRHGPGARQRRAGRPGRRPYAEPDGPERARLPDGPEGQARGHRGRECWRFRGGIPHLQRRGTQPPGLHTVRRSRDGGRAERGAEASGRALTASGRGRGPDREASSCRPAPQDAEEGSASQEDDPAAIARDSGFGLSTVDVAAFEVCFDLYGDDRLLATFLYDGKPRNAYVDDPAAATDDPVGWCIQYSDELSQGDRVVRPFRCPADQLDLATALACGMVQQRMHATGGGNRYLGTDSGTRAIRLTCLIISESRSMTRRPARDRVGQVKILSWNVNGRIEDAARRQIRAVLRRDPDVICLQEVTGRPGWSTPGELSAWAEDPDRRDIRS